MGYSQLILSPSSEISLVTCRPGDQLYNLFGHTSIKISDPANNKTEYFNYGLFNFSEPGFTQKFLRGKLLYQLGVESQQRFLPQYAYAKRSVFEQVLNLDSIQKQKIYDALIENYKPENRYYLYDFFFDNCSTRPRDIILNNVAEVTITSDTSDLPSFRHLLDLYTFSSPWTDFGIDLIIGSIADRPASVREQMFLPEMLYRHFAQAKKENEPLVTENKLILNHEDQIKKRSEIPFLTPSLFFALLLCLELYLLIFYKRFQASKFVATYDKIWFILMGIGSVILLFMWFGTDHIATKKNLNCLWMNPLFLYISFKRQKTVLLICALLMIMAMILSSFIQEIHATSIIIIAICLFKISRQIMKSQLD